MALKEYKPGTSFPGVIGRTPEQSQPAWPQPVRAREGIANVLFIVLDDTGFGQLGCYGSPIRTPNIDRLAAGGLRFTNMHTTALCSPSRACILTGRNHHSNAMACITEGSTGYPGSSGVIPFENGFLSEILQGQGYNTYALGKWHLTPSEQTSAAGPYDRWPLGRGFERYYGFLGGDTSQYYPDLVHDNHQVAAPGRPEEGYHLTPDLVDHAIRFIADSKQVAPDKPFFLYFATGAMHAPHHVPREWADRYKGQFDEGWDVYREKVFARQKELGLIPPNTQLPAQDPDVAEWESLPADEKRLYARMMEVFAGYLEHTDHQIGRLLVFLERMGQMDNTLIMLISDNGASAEGGPTGSMNENKFFNNVPESMEENLKAIDELGGPRYFNHYSWGWTLAGNTPFRRWKRETYRGGTSDPFIIHWPQGIQAKGEIRTQYCHAIDLVPTVLECLGVEPPTHIRGVTQSPIEGISLKYCLDDAKAESRHHTQYFEMFAHRAIYHDGWRAVCPVPGPSFKEAGMGFGQLDVTEEKLRELDAKGWELYHVAEDFSESRNVAQQERGKLIEMIALWYLEAGKYKVLPLDSRGTARFLEQRPQLTVDRKRYTYFPETSVIGPDVAPKVLNRPHSITATVELTDGEEGVLVAHGGNTGGFSLFVKDHRLHYTHNYVGSQQFHVVSDTTLTPGKHELRYEFEPTGTPDLAQGQGSPGRAQLYVDGKLAGQMQLPVTVPMSLGLGEGLSVGRDEGSPVSTEYEPPFAFTGKLESVTVDVSGELIEDKDAQTRRVMARQ
jgi:arylsulfatase